MLPYLTSQRPEGQLARTETVLQNRAIRVQWGTIAIHRGDAFVHLKDDQINRLADKVLDDLLSARLITVKKERGKLVQAIRDALALDQKAEESLERDAERLLEQSLAAMGGGAGIDRHKMLRMIKEKLAKDRKIVL